jgi:hypothetical protein
MLMKITFCVILLLPLGIIAGNTQSAITSSGSDSKGTGGFVSWSVGQVAYTNSTGKGGVNSIAAGVQQAYTISVIKLRSAASFSYSVYPNPTADNLILEASNFKTGKITYQLLDLKGNILRSDFISGNRTEISTGTLPSSTYILQIIQENKQVQSFKVIKN